MHNKHLQTVPQAAIAMQFLGSVLLSHVVSGLVVLGLTVPTTVLAADGIVVLQREVPARPAIRDGEPGRAVTIDTSPDDKIKAAVGQNVGAKPMELDDAEFSAISTNTPASLRVSPDANKLSGAVLDSYGLGNNSNPAQSATSTLAGTIGGAVGGAVGGLSGQINAGINGTSNALNGMTGAIMRSSGQ